MNFYAPDYLAECFHYDAESGVLRWKGRPRRHFNTDQGWKCFNSRDAGRTAGGLQPNGYLALRLDRQMLYVHRIVWAIATQTQIPAELVIDHVNGNKIDNRICNLRLATRAQNVQNSKQQERSQFGKGICFDKSRNKFIAHVTVNGKHLRKRFSSLEEAKNAVSSWRDEHHGDFANHGDCCAR